MTRSSRTRRAKARARKNARNNIAVNSAVNSAAQTAGPARLDDDEDSQLPAFSATDKRYLLAFTVLSIIITAIYWSMGGRNLFVFPALLCISVGARKYWSGPVRRFADSG